MKLYYSMLASVVVVLFISLMTQTEITPSENQIAQKSNDLAQVVSSPPIQPTQIKPTTPAIPASCTGPHKRWVPSTSYPVSPGVCIKDYMGPNETLDKNLQDGHVRICQPKKGSRTQENCGDIFYKCTKGTDGKFARCKISVVASVFRFDDVKCTIEPPFDPANPTGTYKLHCDKDDLQVNMCLNVDKDNKLSVAECPIVVPQ